MSHTVFCPSSFPALFAAACLCLCAIPVGAHPLDPLTKAVPQGADNDLKGQRKTSAQVIVLYAHNGKKGIDSKIGDMAQLKKPPFSAYDSYELISRDELALSTKPAKLALPNKGDLRLQLLHEVSPKTKKNTSKKIQLAVSITKTNGKKFVSTKVKARRQEMFFLAGQNYKKGILVIGIRLR